MRYRTTILQTGPTTTGIPVPDDVLVALGQGRRPPVRVTVGDHTYRSTVATMGGRTLISLSAENRSAAGVAGGQDVEVEVEVDLEPRTVDLPAELAEALAEAGAQDAFSALSPSRQKAHALAVQGAKTDETRRRRIDAVLTALREDTPRTR
ncbi:YdeI/OmpD-associated family protein [Actinotalea sp. K2]|uniref:YdeI/OmpD-associated family protein n=1 Tax=Actinotalea sp. K2 TaxID=2939438 RepID=UPI002016ABDD|nr:YdeI/OmpD-associated family protein [Actinotalea sp. K2]MCL3860970.1 YdeI/OmpD-associated family protein [Actinotalea sp. K2]